MGGWLTARAVTVFLLVAMLIPCSAYATEASPGTTFMVGSIEYEVLSGTSVQVDGVPENSVDVEIPAGVEYEGTTYTVSAIGDHAFNFSPQLTSVRIPDSVISIGDGAFRYCIKLTSVTIPDSVISIGGSAFSHCASLASIAIPDSVTSIENGTF
ncbi:MAG: leucine-rich repeat domain-containing protein, partial [Coriobacteriia bacterium]|nr:leucine-rich repeat domain-containing protein [Coriobacteriia bacterium]